MKLDIISYSDLNDPHNLAAVNHLQTALFEKGIVGIKGVPQFVEISQAYIDASRKFASLNDHLKQQYAPNREANETEGYELGAEWFKNKKGEWQIDDKKASFYAFVPNQIKNKWPSEVDLKTACLALGELIFKTGKLILNVLGLNESVGLQHDLLIGHGRMLHYQKESDATNENREWCGAHLDHGVFTGLIPAYYFRHGVEVDEPEEAGLYIVPSDGNQFEKITAEKDILLFQVGEFAQLLSNDRIKATKHTVRKAQGEIERFTFALFYDANDDMLIKSQSTLIEDDRYKLNQFRDGSISYANWGKASYARYRAKD